MKTPEKTKVSSRNRVDEPVNPGSSRARRAPKPASKRYHHGNLRDALLLAADAVLAARGVPGITLRDVAKVAGVSHAAPYHHFASLDDLLAAVAERAFITLGDAVERASAVADTRERLLRISEAYVNSARAHPARFRLMFGPLLARKRAYPAMQAASERAFGVLLAAACAHDKKNGPELALCGWSLAHGLSNLIIDGAFTGLPMKAQNPDRLPRQLTLRLLGAKGAGAGKSGG